MKIFSILSPELSSLLHSQVEELVPGAEWQALDWSELGNISDPLPDLLLLSPQNRPPVQLLQSLYPLIRLELPTLVFVDEVQQEHDWPDGGALDFVFAPWSTRSLHQHLKLALKMAKAHQERLSYAKEVSELHRRIETLNPRDLQTGLYNRRSFEERLQEEWRRSHRHALSLSLLLFRWQGTLPDSESVDIFQDLIADMSPMRCSDLAARFDEHTLAVLLPQTLESGAETVARSLYQSLLPRAQKQGLEIQVGLFSCQPPSLLHSEQLLSQAEAALASSVFC
jgi:GGDEF domain-containing protein